MPTPRRFPIALTPLTRLDSELRAILDPRRLLRWVYLGRLSVASSIFIAAVVVWPRADTDTNKLLVASLAFVLSIIVTVISFGYTEIYQRPLTGTFRYLQSIFDLLLVTAVVHVTADTGSQFSALYILVIAAAALLLPAGGALLVAALGNVLYVGDVVFFGASMTWSVWLQLGVFAVVALGSAFLSSELQRVGEGTDRLAAELQHARLQADEILRNIRSGVLTVDGEERLLYVNPTAEQLLGLDLAEKLGRAVVDEIGTVAPELAAALRRSAHGRTRRVSRAEGIVASVARRFPVGVTITSVDREGDPTPSGRTVTAIFSDISEQKQMETLRLRAERLEGVAELSASLAHEIKNPLASIRSAVEQLSRMPKTTDDERTLSSLVMRESDRLSRLLSEFLDFARVRVARTEPVDLGDIARGAASLVAAHPDRREDVRVTCIVPERASLVVEGDEDLLHRAVFNLALNAVQASPAGGEVRIEVTPGTFDPLPASAHFDASTVTVRISDEGSGIAPEARDRLFDPFFTTKPGGSGLGLAVVHRAIEAHRGLVFVDSSARGTRFTVVVPSEHASNGSLV